MVSRQYLDDIDFWVKNESRTVSYRWLSGELNVSCDTAKRMLYEYDTQHPGNALYLVAGTSSAGENVSVVPSADLEAAKKVLDEVRALHVFAIAPSAPKDSSALYHAEYEQARDLQTAQTATAEAFRRNGYSSVTCAGIRQLSKAEVMAAPEARPIIKESSGRANEPLPSLAKKKTKANAESFFASSSKAPAKKSGAAPTKARKASKGGAGPGAAAPASAGADPASAAEPKAPSGARREAKSKGSGRHGKPDGAADVFVGDVEESDDELDSTAPAEDASAVDKENDDDAATNAEASAEASAEDEPSEAPAGKKRGRKKKAIMPGAMDDFVHVSDSPKRVAPAPAQGGARKRTVRKLVTRTYQDEKGYLVTAEEYVEEEVEMPDEPPPAPPAAEGESPPKRQKVEAGGGAQKPAPGKSKAQKSLTSFFGRR